MLRHNHGACDDIVNADLDVRHVSEQTTRHSLEHCCSVHQTEWYDLELVGSVLAIERSLVLDMLKYSHLPASR